MKNILIISALFLLSLVASAQNTNTYSPVGFNGEKFWGDTLPYRAMAAIRDLEAKDAAKLKRFIADNALSGAQVSQLQAGHNYFAVESFYSYIGNNKFKIRDAYKRNYKSWKAVQDSLFTLVSLSNDEALASPTYKSFISDFLLREKERLWEESDANPEAFFSQWYGTGKEEGMRLLGADMSNLLKEKIINHYFTGKTAEYMYSVLFSDLVEDRDPTNALLIYANFIKKYPQSQYLSTIEPQMKKIEENERRQITSKMQFFADNGTKLNTFDELLAQLKGKVVLLDMWGTWCAPCREEIDAHSAYLKSYFAGKGLDYVYVANFDQRNEKKWRDLIAYFNMEGMHILANEALNEDIMKRIKGHGYPTYAVISKDGSFELSKAGYPLKRNVLVKQLEEALAK